MISKHTFKKTHNNFYEKQKLNSLSILLVLLLIEGVFVYQCVEAIVAHKPFIFSTFNKWPLLLFTLFVPTLLLLIYQITKLETIFNDDGIFYRWMPFSKRYKMIQWDAVKEVTLIQVDKSGVLLWISKKYDNVNYLSGKYAVVLVMKSGKKRLVGTNKAENVNRVLTRLAGKIFQPVKITDIFDFRD